MKRQASGLTYSGRIVLQASLSVILSLSVCIPGAAQYDGRVRSEHIRIKIPREREWLGRDAILELEQCWQYVNRVTGQRLPRVVLVSIDWARKDNSIDFGDYTIAIGMAHPAAAPNMKTFLVRNATREIARLGLAELSRGGTLREESRFLAEGMCEILAREYDLSTKSLTGAWVITHFLDRIRPLSLEALSSWSTFSGGRGDLESAAPGITFLTTCRDLHGRERVLKLFEALKKGNMKEALFSTFRSSGAVLEDAWLRKVRAFRATEDVVATSEDDAPQLRKTVLVPPAGRRGTSFQMRLFFQDRRGNPPPGFVFVEEKESGLVLQGREPAEKGERFTLVEIPIEEKRQPGTYSYRITAVDESGNVRTWQGSYTVEP